MGGDNTDAQPSLSRAEFWQRASGVAFGLLAFMIPLGVSVVKAGIEDVLKVQREQIDAFNQYVLSMERRVTLIEERQARVLQAIAEHERKLESANGNIRGQR